MRLSIAFALTCFILYCGIAQSGTFGGIDITTVYDSNFNASTNTTNAASEISGTLSGLFGYYRPMSKNIISSVNGGIVASRFNAYNQLNGHILNIGFGSYFRIDKINSISVSLIGIKKFMVDSSRNGSSASSSIAFKQKWKPTMWLTEKLSYGRGFSQLTTGDYTSLRFASSLKWKTNKRTVLGIGVSISKHDYSFLSGSSPHKFKAKLMANYNFNRDWYAQGRLATEYNQTSYGSNYLNHIFSTGFGYQF